MNSSLSQVSVDKSSALGTPLPPGWIFSRLKDFIQEQYSGIWGGESLGNENDVKCLRVADFDFEHFGFKDVSTIRNITPIDLHKKRLRKPSLLIEKSGGGDKQPVGRVILYESTEEMVCANFIDVLRLKKNHDYKFFTYLFYAAYANAVNWRSIKQNTGIQNLDTQAYFSEQYAIPNFLLQQKIVSYLDQKIVEIDRQINVFTRKRDTYNKLKYSLVNHTVVSGLRKEEKQESGIAWIGKVPAHWSKSHIAAITEVFSENDHPDETLLSVYRDHGVVPKASRTDNHNRAGSDLSKYKLIDPGDLVLNKMKTWQGSLAVSNHRGIVSPAYITCKLDKRKVDPLFIHFLLRSRRYIGQYASLSYGVRNNQWDMRYHDFKYLPIFLPSKEEQSEIAQYLEEKTQKIDQLVEAIDRQIATLQEFRKTLINDVVTGKVKVT